MTHRRTFIRLVTIAAVAALMLFATAPIAFAATGDPTLGLAALQDKIEGAGYMLPGYMKTVDQGSTIETIPVMVEGLTDGTQSDSLILFEATGTEIASYGGIVAGMSGSPIYVSDGGVDKVIGAVSYGNYFTIGGTGLATPIESMLKLTTDYPVEGVTDLSTPVTMGGKVIDKVIISSHPETLRAASVAGAFVARPLGEAYIGGLRPGTEAYDDLSSALTKQGLTVIRVGSGLSAGASSFSTDLVPGAGIGVLAARGDMWMGSIGTVTYTDGDTVLAFGHPAYWTGPTSLYMTNVWITGVWPSLQQPTKIGYPTAIRGTITQDRNAGVMGEIGGSPAEAPVTAEVTDTDNGQETTSTVWMSSQLLDDGTLSSAVGSALSVAGYDLDFADSSPIPGSADTTTTVVVSNGSQQYTVVMTNLFDDSSDIVYASTADAQDAVTALLAAANYGIETPHIVSVDLQASVTPARRSATIVGVNALEPLQPGDNAVRVSFLARGQLATQTVDATITIPDDTPLNGTLVASCLSTNEGDGSIPAATPTRQTIAQISDALEAAPSNDTVIVDYYPDSGVLPLSSAAAADPDEPSDPSTEATAATPWVLGGSASTQVTQFLSVSCAPMPYGGETDVVGVLSGPQDTADVSVYTVAADGSPGELLATGTVDAGSDIPYFDIPIGGLTASTYLLVEVTGGDGFTPAETYVHVTVRGLVGLRAVPTTIWRGSLTILTATMTPRSARGTVRFQYYDARRKTWRTVATRKITHTASSTKATFMWWPPRGTWKVRAVWGGNANLGAGTSSTVTLRVR